MAWNADIAREFWQRQARRNENERAERKRQREELRGMRYYVMDRESARYFEKADGSRVWHLSREDAMRMSNFAIVVALDERNFNESLNCYLNGELYKQLAYDERNGWIS